MEGNIDSTLSTRNIHLAQELGLFGALSLVLGNVIGSGIFVTPGNVLKGSGSVAMSFVVWIVAGIISIMGGLAFSELGSMIPRAGSEYSYQLNGLGAYPAFLFAGTFVFLVKPTSFSIGCQVFANYGLTLFLDPEDPNNTMWIKVISVACIVIHSLFGIVSLKIYSQVQIFTTLTKVAAILLIICGGLFNLIQGYHENFTERFWDRVPSTSETSFESISNAFFSALYALNGWQIAGDLAEEIRKPKRNVPLSLIIGITSILIMYILVNISYLSALTPDELILSPSVAADWAKATLEKNHWSDWGTLVPMVVTITVALSSFGGTLSGTLAGTRLIFAAGREGHLPRMMSYLHTSFRTPILSVLLNGTFATIITLVGDYSLLINLYGFSTWFFLGLTMITLLVMRGTRKDIERPFKTWIIAPILVLILAIYLIVVPIVFDPKWTYLGTLVYFGILTTIYFFLIRGKQVDPEIQTFNSFERALAKIFHLSASPRLERI